MSRSKRLPIIKDGPRNQKKSKLYWRTIRSVTNQVIRSIKYKIVDSKDIEESSDLNEIPNPKSIINDYNYCDYIFDYRNKKDLNEDKKKYTRK